MLLYTRDVKKGIEFYTKVLGLRLSDRSGYDIAFLHGIHGSDHHMIALARTPRRPGHHHFSWDVGSVDEIGAGAKHMLDKGLSKRAGGSAATCSAPISSITCRIPGAASANIPPTSTMCRSTRDWPSTGPSARELVLRLGPKSAPGFVHNYEAD